MSHHWISMFIYMVTAMLFQIAQQQDTPTTTLTQSVRQFGQQIGLALLDSLLQKGQEEVARGALQRQIELLDEINPSYAKLLRQIPPETIIQAALAQRQQANGPAPDTGDPFLNVLAKNGIVVNGSPLAPPAAASPSTLSNGTLNNQQLGNLFQAVLRNVLQAVQPSAIQNSLLGPQLPSQEVTNPLEPKANQLLIPQPSNGGLPSLPFISGGAAADGLSPSSFPSAVAPGSVALKTEVPEAPPNPFASRTEVDTETPPPPPFPFGATKTTKRPESKKISPKRHRLITTAPPNTPSDDDFATDVEEHIQTTTSSSLTDQKRLQQINSRAIRLLAYRKQQVPLPERKSVQPPVVDAAALPVWSKEQGVPQITTYDTVPPKQPLVAPPLNLRLDRLTDSTVLSADSRLSTLNEDGGAWQPPAALSRGAAAVGRKKQHDLDLSGQVNLPNDWLAGQHFSLDGSIGGRNNNDVFSGMEF